MSTTSLVTRIESELKEAMLAKDAVRRDALRLILSSLRSAEKAVQRVPEILECHLMSGQFDYLLRLAHALGTQDARLREHGHAIRAVGVIGNDPYDKLLVLQALRPQFPDAVFFTNDLDARRYLIAYWTRLSDVVSVVLGPRGQHDITHLEGVGI